MHTIFWSENLKGTDYFGDLSIDGTKILKYILNDSDNFQWQNIVNTNMNIAFHNISYPDECLSVSQEVSCSTQLV